MRGAGHFEIDSLPEVVEEAHVCDLPQDNSVLHFGDGMKFVSWVCHECGNRWRFNAVKVDGKVMVFGRTGDGRPRRLAPGGPNSPNAAESPWGVPFALLMGLALLGLLGWLVGG